MIEQPTGADDLPRRVLAGFGSLADESATIEAALTLARALESDVAGHFIEDTDLLNLAGLPFARIVRAADTSIQQVGADQMQRELERAALAWKRALYAGAERSSIRCTFQSSAGQYSAEIAKASGPSDFIVFNPANLPHRHPQALARLLHTLRGAAGTALLPERAARTAAGPVVIVTGDADSEGLLALAARLTRILGRSALILTAQTDIRGLRERAHALFTSAIDIQQLHDSVSLAQVLSRLHPSFVIVEQSARISDRVEASLLLRAAAAPLLLLRRDNE